MLIEELTHLFMPTGFAKHYYNVFSSGTNLRERRFNTRKEAESYMYTYCLKHNIKVECRECDKHERVYTNHNGVRFYINRI